MARPATNKPFNNLPPIQWRLVIAAVIVSVAALIFGYITSNRLPAYPTKVATIKDERFTLLVPRTAEEQERGLAAVERLPKRHGMLFNGDGEIGIWMKDMQYPIDIIWLDAAGTVIHLVENAEPSSYPTTIYQNPESSRAATVIELNAGEVSRLRIQRGEVISIR